MSTLHNHREGRPACTLRRVCWHLPAKLHGVTAHKPVTHPPRAIPRLLSPGHQHRHAPRLTTAATSPTPRHCGAACTTRAGVWDCVRLEKLTVPQLVKKFNALYGIRMFITVFTTAHHLSVSCVRLIQSTTSKAISLRSVLILSSYLRLCIPSGLLPAGSTLHMPHTLPISSFFI